MAAEIVLDSNVLLRLLAREDRRHADAQRAVARALGQGHAVRLLPQVVMESWVVLTRPREVNGFGWTVAEAADALGEVIQLFPLLPETEAVFAAWWDLVKLGIHGKRAHDARLAAAMKVHGVRLLMTFNTDDFTGLPEIAPFAPGSNPDEP